MILKRTLKIVAVALLTLWPGQGDAERIVILHTNDTHSQIDAYDASHKRYGNMGGVVRRMALIDSIRAAEPYVLLVDAGDAVQGKPYFNIFGGEVEFEVMNAMRYDVRTLGNHEFDAGMENLARLVAKSPSDFIASNYDLSRTPLAGLVKEFVIKEVAGVRMGFFSLNVNPEGLIPAKLCEGLVYHNPIETANRMAKFLRNEGADIVVALSHLGYTTENEANPTDSEVAQQSAGIDIIIGAHSHTKIDPAVIDANPNSTIQYRVKNKEGKEVLIAQTGEGGAYLGYIVVEF